MFPRIRVIAITTLLALAATTARADEAPKKDDLNAAVKKLATQVKQLMEDERQETVALSDFKGPSDNANFGPGLKNMLANELAAQKVSMSNKAHLTVQGSYKLENDEQDIRKIQQKVLLEATVEDSAQVKRGTFRADIRTNGDIAKLMGVTTALNPKGNKQTRNEQIQDAAENPNVAINGSLIKAKANSPFSVELLVGKQGRTASIKNGQAFVDILRDETYAVKVTNNSDHEVAVTLNIDGLDVFSFSEDIDPQTKRPRFSHYIVPAKSSSVIQGWHKTSNPNRKDNVLAFLVAEYAKSLHFSEKSSGPVGVLTVTFALSGVQPTDLPPEDAKTAQENGTTFGPPIAENQKPLQRTFGDIRDVVTVRYTR